MVEMAELRCCQTLMPDLQRMGGIAEFIKGAHMVERHGVQVSSHLFTEMSLGILAALDNATYLEVMPWFEPAYLDRVRVEDGFAHVSERPGHGCRLDIPALERMRI